MEADEPQDGRASTGDAGCVGRILGDAQLARGSTFAVHPLSIRKLSVQMYPAERSE